MTVFDFTGRTTLPRGPHAARGPRVEKPSLMVLHAKSTEQTYIFLKSYNFQ